MMKRFIGWILSKFIKDPDFQGLMVNLSAYTPMDRYSDFKKVFGTPAGQRVLTQILLWGRVNKTVFDKEPTVMALKEGERNMALKIVAGLQVPAALPTERRKR